MVNLASACTALAGYNGTGRLTGSGGGWLFSVWAHLDNDSNFYSTAFNPAEPLSTPSGLNPGSPAAPATPLKWLAGAVQNLQAHGIPIGASYGQVQHAPQSRRLFDPQLRHGLLHRDLRPGRDAGDQRPARRRRPTGRSTTARRWS